MKKRLILLAGLGVGYILGSRTGRQSYERLKAQVQELWTDPRIQDTVEKANQSIREKSPAVADAVQTAADRVNAAAATGAPASEFDGDEDGQTPKDRTSAEGMASSEGSSSTAESTPSPKVPDSFGDPERHLDDEGPGGVADDD